MAPWAEITREIDEGPEGPAIGAFFDVDRTLIAGFSAAAFLREAITSGRLRAAELAGMALAIARFQLGRLGFSAFVAGTAAWLRGREEAEIEAAAERLFAQALAGDVYAEGRALVRAHRRKGHTVALVTSATRYQVAPLARDLDVPHVVCTRLDVRDGRLSGDVVRPTPYGAGKAAAARELAARHGVDLARSYAYSDSDEDLPLLELVGHPRPTNPNARLAAIAARRGWRVHRFRSRGTPRPADVVRTALAVASVVPSVLLGVPVAVLDAGWRRAVNVAIATWGELGTALAGIELRVSGEEHLWSHRPAVFVFNHQSAIDMLLLCKLLRRDFVGIAKQEIRRSPIFGPAMALVGTVFIDRFDRERAVQALAPAVEALRSGLSIVIAPEGTRMPTPRLGRFKKGAFRMAMAAGVPIVPIVFRNALDALPKHGLVVRPTVVEAVVHPPIPTAGWTVRDLDRHVAGVRALYERTLEA